MKKITSSIMLASMLFMSTGCTMLNDSATPQQTNSTNPENTGEGFIGSLVNIVKDGITDGVQKGTDNAVNKHTN